MLKRSHLMRVVIKILLFGAMFACIWLLMLPWYIDAVCALLLLCIVYRTNVTELSIGLFGLSIAVLGAYGTLWIITPQIQQFYRDHEKYSTDRGTYRPNVHDVIAQPHGDLVAIDPTLPLSIREPRTVVFTTDSRGYRNNHEYSDEEDILLGDSYLVANGTTQEETVPSRLESRFGKRVYSMAYPGDPADYENQALKALREVSQHSRFSFFIYEGNDFIFDSSKKEYAMNEYDVLRLDAVKHIPVPSALPQILYKLSRKIERQIFSLKSSSTDLHWYGDTPIAFLSLQSATSLALDPRIELQLNPQVWDKAKCVFFIPSKARIYPEGYSSEEQKILTRETAPALDALRKKVSMFPVTVVDLTPALRNAARKMLPEHKFVYWRDDTHWNGLGIEASVEEIARCLDRK